MTSVQQQQPSAADAAASALRPHTIKVKFKPDGTVTSTVDDHESVAMSLISDSNDEMHQLVRCTPSTYLPSLAHYALLSDVGMQVSNLLLRAKLVCEGAVPAELRDAALFRLMMFVGETCFKEVARIQPARLRKASLVGDRKMDVPSFLYTEMGHESMSLSSGVSILKNTVRLVGSVINRRTTISTGMVKSVAVNTRNFWMAWQNLAELRVPVPALADRVPAQFFFGTFSLELPKAALGQRLFAYPLPAGDPASGFGVYESNRFKYRAVAFRDATAGRAARVFYLPAPVLPQPTICAQIYGGFLSPKDHIKCFTVVTDYMQSEFVGCAAAMAVVMENDDAVLLSWCSRLRLFKVVDLALHKTHGGTYRFSTPIGDPASVEIVYLFHQHWWDTWWEPVPDSNLASKAAVVEKVHKAVLCSKKLGHPQTILRASTARFGEQQRKYAAEMKKLLDQYECKRN